MLPKTLRTFLIGLLGLLFGYLGVGEVEAVYIEFPALVLGVIALIEALNGLFDLHGRWAQIHSWIAGVFWTYLGWFLSLGFLSEIEIWWHVGIIGIGVTFAANKVWDASQIKQLLIWLGLLNKPEEE